MDSDIEKEGCPDKSYSTANITIQVFSFFIFIGTLINIFTNIVAINGISLELSILLLFFLIFILDVNKVKTKRKALMVKKRSNIDKKNEQNYLIRNLTNSDLKTISENKIDEDVFNEILTPLINKRIEIKLSKKNNGRLGLDLLNELENKNKSFIKNS